MHRTEYSYETANCIKETNSFGIVLVKKNYNLIVGLYGFFRNLNIRDSQEVIIFLKKSENLRIITRIEIFLAYFSKVIANKKRFNVVRTYKYFFNIVGKNIALIDYLFNILFFTKKKKCYQM